MSNDDEVIRNVLGNLNFRAFVQKVKDGIKEFDRSDLSLILGYDRPASFTEIARFTSIMVSSKVLVKFGKKFIVKDKDKLKELYDKFQYSFKIGVG
jgi:hypothetical protein